MYLYFTKTNTKSTSNLKLPFKKTKIQNPNTIKIFSLPTFIILTVMNENSKITQQTNELKLQGKRPQQYEKSALFFIIAIIGFFLTLIINLIVNG